MDVRMPVTDGIEATRQITAERAGLVPRVLILTTFDLDEPADGQDAREQDPDQARCPRPNPARRPRLRIGPRHHGLSDRVIRRNDAQTIPAHDDSGMPFGHYDRR